MVEAPGRPIRPARWWRWPGRRRLTAASPATLCRRSTFNGGADPCGRELAAVALAADEQRPRGLDAAGERARRVVDDPGGPGQRAHLRERPLGIEPGLQERAVQVVGIVVGQRQ